MTFRRRRFAAQIAAGIIPFLAGCAEVTAENQPTLPKGISPVRLSSSKRVLYIGDSLSVGAFGGAMQAALFAGAGRDHVSVYASCGSAAQHWLASEPKHTTTCGYRETTPTTSIFEDYHNGRKPRPMPTPKIENLLRKHRPNLVIVQLGTNHFDAIRDGGKAALPKQEEIFERFARAIQTTLRDAPQVIWILPPDSAHFSSSTQSAIASVINRVAARHQFATIDSRKFTHYVMGKSGGDGIHYSEAAALSWASAVIREINKLLLPRVHFNN